MSKRANPYAPGLARPGRAPGGDPIEVRVAQLEAQVALLLDTVAKGGAQLAALQATEAEARAVYEKVMAKIRSKPLLAALLK